MTTVPRIAGEKRPFKEWTGEFDFTSQPRYDGFENLKDWYAPIRQSVKGTLSYGQLKDGFSRSMFRMQVERDADEGMRGYHGGSGSGDTDSHKQSYKGNETVDFEQSDAEMMMPTLPDIPNYDELLRTKEGRDEIRRIRQRQSREQQ